VLAARLRSARSTRSGGGDSTAAAAALPEEDDADDSSSCSSDTSDTSGSTFDIAPGAGPRTGGPLAPSSNSPPTADATLGEALPPGGLDALAVRARAPSLFNIHSWDSGGGLAPPTKLPSE
jgi:hypothetical protein